MLSFRRVVVPGACVVRRGTDTLVFLVREGRAREQRVVLDTTSPGAPASSAAQVWIEKGLDGGEVLVVRPGETLRDMQRVRPRA